MELPILGGFQGIRRIVCESQCVCSWHYLGVLATLCVKAGVCAMANKSWNRLSYVAFGELRHCVWKPMRPIDRGFASCLHCIVLCVKANVSIVGNMAWTTVGATTYAEAEAGNYSKVPFHAPLWVSKITPNSQWFFDRFQRLATECELWIEFYIVSGEYLIYIRLTNYWYSFRIFCCHRKK